MNEHQAQAALPAPERHEALPAPEPSKGGGIVRMILVLLVIAAAVGATVWKIRKNTAEQAVTTTRAAAAADRALPVLVAPVVQKKMPIYLTALGTVTAYNSVTIKSRVDGQLMSVPVREGQAVSKGQLLAEIDPAPYKAALAQAEGQLAKDQAASDYAHVEAKRYQDLYDAGVVSKDSAQTQQSTAGQTAGAIQADNAAIQAAKVNLLYTDITSPINGVVGLRQVDPGNIVHASDTTGLLLVTQLQPISVIFTLPEDQLPEVLKLVRGGKKLAVEAYDRSETTHLASGTLLTLDNSIDPTTGTDKIKAVFPNTDGALFPNQFVNVRLILQERPDALVVPASAIQTGSQGSFVYVVKKGNPPGGGARRRSGGSGAGAAAAPDAAPDPATASTTPAAPPRDPYYVVTQPVKIDLTEGTQVILASGVAPGDQVVIDGQEKLQPNSRVTPRTQDSTGGAGGRQAGAGQGAAPFGPGTAGPSDAPSNPGKRGLETGTGVRPGRRQTPADAPAAGTPDHPHHRPGGQSAGGPQQ